VKIYLFCVLALIFCNLGILSVSPHDGDSHADTAAPFWEEHLETFQKYLKTDPDAARTELHNVAQSVFKGHLLAEEWVPLYFRIHKTGTKYPSDMKRVHELAIRMLTDIDAKMYAPQIQHHRAAFEHYTALQTAVGDERLLTEKASAREQQSTSEKTKAPETSEKQNVKLTYQHYKNFFNRLATDKAAAQTELDAFAALAFQGHPQTAAWKSLFFRLALEKEGTVTEILQLHELKKQMLMDIDSKKHAKEIKSLESAVKQLTSIEKLFEQQGTLATEKVTFDPEPKNE